MLYIGKTTKGKYKGQLIQKVKITSYQRHVN